MDTTNLLLIAATAVAITIATTSITSATVTITEPERFDANAQSINSFTNTLGSNVAWTFGSYSMNFYIIPALVGTVFVHRTLSNNGVSEQYDDRMEYENRDQDADLASFMQMQQDNRLNADVLENMGQFENQF
jgi:uncharacterized membrane protein